jgi:hypothetical protein
MKVIVDSIMKCSTVGSWHKNAMRCSPVARFWGRRLALHDHGQLLVGNDIEGFQREAGRNQRGKLQARP